MSRDSILQLYRYHKYVIEIAKTFGGCASRAHCTAQGKDFDLSLMVKMETRRPVARGPFSREFLAFVIIASYDGLKSQDLEYF